MKLIVKKAFRDKNDHVTVYEPETILEVNDKARASALTRRGLCAKYEGKKAAAITLGEEAAADEAPDTPAEAASETQAEGEEPKGEKE